MNSMISIFLTSNGIDPFYVKAGILAGCIVVYIGLCLWLKGLENIYIYMGLGFMLIVLSILFFFGKTQYVRFTKSALLVVTCIYLGLNGFIVYDKNFLEMSNVYNKLDQVRTSYETGLGKTASYCLMMITFIVL